MSAAFTAHQCDDVLVNLRLQRMLSHKFRALPLLIRKMLQSLSVTEVWRFQESSAWCSGREGCGRQMAEQLGAGSAGWVFAGRQRVPSTMLAGTFRALSTAGALEQRG